MIEAKLSNTISNIKKTFLGLELNFSCIFSFSFVFLITSIACHNSNYQNIDGFDENTNQKLSDFIKRTKNHLGRKVAVFDGDGTVLGQVPHYLADECLYERARKEPQKKSRVISSMKGMSNVSLPYVQKRVFFYEGDLLESVREQGIKCFDKYYPNKVFKPMQDLIATLKSNNFEVWIVTASPESLYQGFLSREFNIPITNIVGVKSVIHGGKITNRIIQPVPQDHGKKEAIESFIQATPLLAAGNSRGDKEMIEFGSDIKMIINPDTHIAPDQKESISDYAKKNGWLIVKIKDTANKNFPYISSKHFGIRLNKKH